MTVHNKSGKLIVFHDSRGILGGNQVDGLPPARHNIEAIAWVQGAFRPAPVDTLGGHKSKIDEQIYHGLPERYDQVFLCICALLLGRILDQLDKESIKYNRIKIFIEGSTIMFFCEMRDIFWFILESSDSTVDRLPTALHTEAIVEVQGFSGRRVSVI